MNDRWSWIVGFHDQRFLVSIAVASQSTRDTGGDGMGRTTLMLDEEAVVAARELARREHLSLGIELALKEFPKSDVLARNLLALRAK